MSEKDPLKRSLLELADTVEKSHDENGAWRLRTLAEAISGGARAIAWANKDVYQIVNPDMIVERYRNHYTSFVKFAVSTMELLRNILIFAPIIVTWYGISQATAAYHDLLSATLNNHPEQSSQPFLYLWEQGFGGRLHPSWLILSNIGWIDAGILAFIFIITLFAFLLSNIHNALRERATLQLQEDLTHAISGATLRLASPATQPFLNANTELEEVAKQLLQRSTQILDGFNNLVSNTSKEMEKMTQNLATRLDTLAEEMGKRFTAISQEMTDQLKEGNNYLTQLRQFAANTDQLSQEMRASAQSLNNANKGLASSIDGLAGPAKDIVEQQKVLMKATSTAMTLLQGAATALVDIGQKQSAWGDQFNQALGSMEQVLERAQDMTSHISSFTTQQHMFLAELQKEREAQGQLAIRVAEATEGVRETLDVLQVHGRDLRDLSVDTRDLYETYSRIAQSNLPDVLEHYTSAAQVIEKAGDNLQVAASAIFKASRELEKMSSEQNQQRSPIK